MRISYLKGLLALIFLFPALSFGQVKVQNLPSGTTPSSGDFGICDQSGVTNKCTYAQIAASVNALLGLTQWATANYPVLVSGECLSNDGTTLSWITCPGGTPANPTATIAGPAVNGTATTYMRSDAAPALSTTGIAAGAYTNANVTVDIYGRITVIANGSSGGSVSFSGVTTGTNAAALHVGTGGSLDATGAGTIAATSAPIAGVTGLGAGCATWLTTPSSANLLACVTGESGTGALLFGTAPSFSNPTITGGGAFGTPASLNLSNALALPCAALPGFTGDMTTSAGSCVSTLASTAVTAGSYTSANITVDAKGRVTAAANGGASATSITPGTTTVVGATAPCLIDNSASTTMNCAALASTLAINSNVLGTTVPNRTVTTSPTVAAGDMGGLLITNVTGGGTVTIPAISSTVFANGESLSITNYSASTAAISTTPTINAGAGCVSGTGIPSGDTWELTSNGTTLDCNQTVSSGSGTGTVTHTGGALTANAVMLGAGAADSKVVAGITTDGTSKLNLGVAGTSVGGVALANATSGTITLAPVPGALGSVTASFPANTGTVGELNLAQTWSATQTFVAPVLGTIASGTATNLLGLPVGGIAAMAANTFIANVTGSSAIPTAVTDVSYLIDQGTKFTAAGTGTCATVTTTLGGTSVGSLKCTGTSGASTVTITLPTAPNGWMCDGVDVTTTTDLIHMTSNSTTTCVLSGTLVANDVLVFKAMGY